MNTRVLNSWFNTNGSVTCLHYTDSQMYENEGDNGPYNMTNVVSCVISRVRSIFNDQVSCVN